MVTSAVFRTTVLRSFYILLVWESSLNAADTINSTPNRERVWKIRSPDKHRNADEISGINLNSVDSYMPNSVEIVSDFPDEQLVDQKRLLQGETLYNVQSNEAINSNKLNPSSMRRNSKQNGVLGVDYFEMELQIILDTVLVRAIESSNKHVLEYLATFVHTVNHMYSMSYPEGETFPIFKVKAVELKLLDVEEDSEIFMSVTGDEVLDIQLVLTRLRKQAKRGKFDKYDHTMLLTGRDLYRKSNGQYQPDVLGAAFLNGSCSKTTSGKYNALSVVEDVGARYLGVYPAVHELAHNLGAKHDAKTKHCEAIRGYIMSPVTERTDNMFKFSKCSLSSLSTFFYSEYGKCLTEGGMKSLFPENSPAPFPGEVYTMDHICEHLAAINFGNEVSYESKVNSEKNPNFLCKQISCHILLPGNREYTLEPPFAPGEYVPCGDGRRCESGECVQLPP